MATGPAGAPAPTFTPNGTQTAKDSDVTFQMADAYEIHVLGRDASGASTLGILDIDAHQRATDQQIAP